jgi:hypothetical protein
MAMTRLRPFAPRHAHERLMHVMAVTDEFGRDFFTGQHGSGDTWFPMCHRRHALNRWVA